MKFKIIFVIIFSISMFIFAPILYAQNSEKTIKLDNSEVIHDLNGEWDVLVEPYYMKPWPQIWKITQKGAYFTAVRMMDDSWMKKGDKMLEGELLKNGIMKVTLSTQAWGFVETNGQISDDGKRIIIDVVDKTKYTATRK